ncbi:CBS domain-containing protein, partial [Clostridium botulinum]
MKDMIYITGHKNPDTDSICSAIAYAEFKNKSANVEAKPIRLGDISRETQFALDYFNVKEPELIKTLKPLVKDLEMDKVAPLYPKTSLKTAWAEMKKNNVKTIPVVGEDNKFLGIVSLSNLTSAYMDIWDNYILTKSRTPFENVVDTLSAKILCQNDKFKVCGGKILVAAMSPDSMKRMMEIGDVVICGNRED